MPSSHAITPYTMILIFKGYGLILETNYWVRNRHRLRQGTLPIAEP